MKIITTLLLTLCIFGQAFATNQTLENVSGTQADKNQASIILNTESYSVPEGLSQSVVSSIVEDKNGFLWIGTINGLNRFDGQNFKQYFSDNSGNGLPSSFIRSLALTPDGNLLVGTDKGLTLYNQSNDRFEADYTNQYLKTASIWSLNSNGEQIIIGTNDKIINTDHKLSKFQEVSNSSKFNGVKKAIKLEQGYLTRNSDGSVFTINNEGIVSLVTKDSIEIEIFNKDIIIISNTGVFTLKNKNYNLIAKRNFDGMSSLDGKPILINGKNLYTINDDFEIIHYGKINVSAQEIKSPRIYSGKNSLYIATINTGFFTIKDQKNLISTLSIGSGNIWSLKNNDGKLTVASDSTNIDVFDKDLKLIQSFDTGIEGFKSIEQINNDLFIGSLNGLFKLDANSGKLNKLKTDKFTIIKKNKITNTLYAGTLTGELYIFNKDLSFRQITIDPKNPIFDIENINSKTFIASQGGLFEIDKTNKVKHIYNKDLVFSLHKDNGKLYFGTRTSFLEMNIESYDQRVIKSNNKAVFSISSIDDYIVASSIQEVILLSKTNSKTYVLSNLYGSQNEYNTQSITTFNQHLLVGGTDGVSYFSTKKFDDFLNNKTLPKTQLHKLLVFNVPEVIGGSVLDKPLPLTKKIKLKYSDYPFTFQFNTPGAASDRIEYSYQMIGLSESWIESKGINSATYTNLSPGEYTFNIFALDPISGSPGPYQHIDIEITPPWWFSTQAKFIYFMLSLIITGAIVKAVLRRREVQTQIAKSEERLKLSLWGSGDEMWDWDIETGQIYRSNIWGSLEFPRDGQRSGEHGEESNIHPMDQERVSSALNNHFYGKTDHFEAAYRVKGKSDEWVWILDRAKIVERDEKDNALRMTGTIKNINNFKHAEEQLRLFERAIANISEGMFILDSNFYFVEVNEACCELSMTSRDQFIGKQLNFDRYPESYSEQIRSILHQQGSWSNEVESAKGDDSSFLMELTVDAIYDELGQLSHYVGVFSDISRRKQQEEELRKLTNNDLLTNLPNRSSLMVTLGNLVKRDSHHTLMVLDLDNFKKINDSLGHQIGDELLIKVAKRIEDTVPYHTSIYRLGGDEFAILVDNNPDIGSSAVIANKVIDAFVTPFELTSDKVVVGLSIGIVLYPEDDQNEQALLRKADIAMYHAKSGGGNRYQFYSESLNRNAIRQLEVENLIREGLRDDLFEVYYQPKIDLKSGKMAGMEALVRLNHPAQGLIPPSDFIPLAEENGLIVEIGDLVMKKACFAAQKWRSQGIFDGRVAVNLSSYQFALPDLQQRVESILRLTQLPAANLELEITEGTVIKQPEKAIKVMQQLAKMGVSLALDDFGTGYSSLSYLKRFPIHTLKIDKAFVDDIDKSDRDLKMVDSIITIAHNMGLSVVGEGVEDASQLSILKALKCEEIQGFIFSKAVTESQFTELLHKEFIEPESVQKGSKAI